MKRKQQTVVTEGFEQAGGDLFHDAEIYGEGVRVAILDNVVANDDIIAEFLINLQVAEFNWHLRH